ncbi:MAG: DNA-binding transcriptional regulator [Phycisphaerae bacterium]|nr:DNA-binding transcriptional regulator [Phycisphaerae bacterium]
MRHVAILVETSRAYGRGLLRGIARYNRERGRWHTYFEPHGLDDPPPAWLRGWKGDGVIARIDNRRMARALLALGKPVVNLRGTVPGLPFPFLGADNEAVARMGTDHLLERGFIHFGFCGFARGYHPGLDHRGECFQRLIEAAGHRCGLYQQPRSPGGRSRLENEHRRLARWIRSLPKPVGIMAANDDRGLAVLNACRRIAVKVPYQVAVLGVDNDEYLCGLSIPMLSSIDINSEETGYKAAALLDRMMSGRKPPRRMPEIRPSAVVARQSTDVLATDDRRVIQALEFIRQNARRPISSRDVARFVGVSRAALGPRFKSVTHRTVGQEIRRVRLDLAKDLLARSNMPIKRIAIETGFSAVQYLTRVFQAATGQTPASFRRSQSGWHGMELSRESAAESPTPSTCRS